MTTTAFAHTRQRGFSLIELMVAITIGLFLLAGAVTIFTTSKRVYNEQDDMARVQDGLRFATDTIARDLRSAGYFGCGYGINPGRMTNNLAPAVTLFQLNRGPVQGNENGPGNQWWPTPAGAAVDTMTNPMPNTAAGGVITAAANSDAITIRHAAGPKWEVTAAMAAATDPTIAVNNTAGTYNQAVTETTFGGAGLRMLTNDPVAISTCGAVDVFTTNAASNGTADTNTIGQAVAGGLSNPYGTDATVSRVTLVRYFVGTDANGDPGLYRVEPNGAGAVVSILLVPGVENMQVLYGIDTLPAATPDGVPDQYVAAGSANLQTPAQWANVVSARIGLVVRGASNTALEAAATPAYSLLGTNVDPPDDARKRRVMETTVLLRNSFFFSAGYFGG